MTTRLSTPYRQPRFSRGIILHLGFALLFILACQPMTIVVTATSLPSTDKTIVAKNTEPSSTEKSIVSTNTLPPSTKTSIPKPTSTPVRITPTSAPSCTALQDLNLRSGPGKAYDPPIGSLVAGTKFVPTGYESQGIPGGPWVQVQVEGNISSQTGWVSAGSQFVSCNLELTTLPAVEVPPPPPTCMDCSSNPNGCGLYDPCSCECISPP